MPMPLVFVPTPLGNLRDITLRSLDALRDCDLLVAEDTRVAQRLLSLLELPRKPTWSYREQNADGATPAILERAKAELVAVVTDAGMPGISDPGRDLILAARAAGVAVEVLPGPTAFVCVAVLSGFDLDGFAFAGFVPRTAQRRTHALTEALRTGATTIWYEAPHRIEATLAALAELEPAARVFLVREFTKLHEQHVTGTPADVLIALEKPVRGEIAFALRAPETPSNEVVDTLERSLRAEVTRLAATGAAPRAIAKELAARFDRSRNDVYRLVLEARSYAGVPAPAAGADDESIT